MADPNLECRDLTQSFRMPDGSPLTAVRQVSLTLAPGQTVVVRGVSGSGKSTLLMMAAGMLQPQSGRVLLDGQDIYAMTLARRAKLRSNHLGVILPMFHLLPYLSAASNVTLGSWGATEKQRAIQLLDRIGLGDRRNQKPDRMSAGECRRLMVARALVHRPRWILADEPTANLDDSSAGLIRALLHEQVQSGCGLLIVTHESPLLFQADATYQMSSGSLERYAD